MKNFFSLFLIFLMIIPAHSQKKDVDFTISFGSCNRQYKTNVLWKEILKNKPNVWIWGGDVIYSDTKKSKKLKKSYQEQWQQKGYKEFTKNVTVIGTWDDHDYGANDAGSEYPLKKESQQLFLDFLHVDKNDVRRKQEGVYHSTTFNSKKGSVKVIVLDTRYFRTALTKSTIKGKRYQANLYGQGTILGKKQWIWLEKELNNSTSDFNIIISSIQLLSNKHGFECWGNFPHEVDKFINIIKKTNAKGVLVLSGDRHISEFSLLPIDGVSYPIIDFTSSGLTHAYTNYSGELNPKRLGKVIHQISFGILHFNFDNHQITMQMRGKHNQLLQQYIQVYN